MLLLNRVAKNLERIARARRLEPASVQCPSSRVFDRDTPELPLALDLYVLERVLACPRGDLRPRSVLLAQIFVPRHGGGPAFLAEMERLVHLAAAALGVDDDDVIFQARDRHSGGEVEAGAAEAAALIGLVREGQALFEVRLGSRRDAGLFFDHRLTRGLVAAAASGKRVLNLFAYTGSFSVQAALAGARATLSVDLSAATCRWAAQNLQHNGLVAHDDVDARLGAHQVLSADVFGFLESGGRRLEPFDLIVLDPPTFSKSRRSARTLDIQRDHPGLILAALALLGPGGTLWFSTNHSAFSLAILPANVVIDELTVRTVPPAFRAAPPPHRSFRITHQR